LELAANPDDLTAAERAFITGSQCRPILASVRKLHTSASA
jgi:hypothetical protein